MSANETMGLTAVEAANECRVSANTFMTWVHQGRVPYIRIGRKYLFNRELLNDFLKGNTSGATTIK